MKPGDRRKRWERSHNTGGIIFAVLGSLCLVGIDGTAGWAIAIFLYLMAALDFYDARVGWKMKDGPSPWVRRMMDRDAKNGISSTKPDDDVHY